MTGNSCKKENVIASHLFTKKKKKIEVEEEYMPTHEAKYSFLLGFTSFSYFGWRKGFGNKIWMNNCCPV